MEFDKYLLNYILSFISKECCRCKQLKFFNKDNVCCICKEFFCNECVNEFTYYYGFTKSTYCSICNILI